MTAFRMILIALTLGATVFATCPAGAEAINGTSINGLSRNGITRNGITRNGWRLNGWRTNGWQNGWANGTATGQDSQPEDHALRVIGIELPR